MSVPDGGIDIEQRTTDDATDAATDVVAATPPTGFRGRMTKAAAAMGVMLGGVRGRVRISSETWLDLEEALLRADVGVKVCDELCDRLREQVRDENLKDADDLLDALRVLMLSRLQGADRTLHFVAGDPGLVNVWLFVGVNGVGKTTTIGKVGAQQSTAGRRVVMAAGDTFRAAAAEQLGTWAERSGAELVRGAEGGDPSSVIFDGVQRARASAADLVLADTAGRLQNKANLMEELRKVRRVADREPGRVTEVLLVIDATTGQNGLSQAREFAEAAGVTGVVLTKLDGSAKGGIVFAIETELGIPVKLVGLGETIDDLVVFEPADFIDALFAG
jgi:fused signal recognition particle receptor